MTHRSCQSVDLILVGCVKSKHHGKLPARCLYRSRLWDCRRNYAEMHGRPWYILSAKHGLLHPDKPIDCYDQAKNDLSPAERREWSGRVLKDLTNRVSGLDGKIIEIHAGKAYVDYGLEKGLRKAGALTCRPLRNVAGHFPQCAWYDDHINSCLRQKGD